ncbi:MAG: hypothetical protein DRR06_04540 [Gammaproteobacteria bacterium]|nr:MAG: hypothetical protein DRR06_04540 [Gammaproteobacteria bacterium]RLA54383.1 MAG: hypothetical protein DRR42_01965 [Gammaproteobacteria bacterium]
MSKNSFKNPFTTIKAAYRAALYLAQILLAVAVSCFAMAHDSKTGIFGFTPIPESANKANWNPKAPWLIPEGFSQSIVADETALNIYGGGINDWNDMNTVNETGTSAGRYLYRTHEVRCGVFWAPFPLCGAYPGGAVSVVDLKTGHASILAQDPSYQALDGIRWSPWGTILFAEETAGGRLFEIVLDKKDRTKGAVYNRPAVGRMAHEGIAVGPDGAIYVVDEWRGLSAECPDGTLPCGGGIYRFIPEKPGDLSSGALYVLGVSATPEGEHNTGQGAWLGPIDAATARESGSEAGGASYQRPEDLEIIGDTLYVAVTEGPRDEAGNELFEGRVLAINLDSMMVTNFIKPGVNAPIEKGKPGEEGFQAGMDSVDNLAATPDGKLMIVEDNNPSDIWVADMDHNGDGQADNVWLFGSLSDPGAEGTGIYFGKDPQTLFVNIQHSVNKDGDATWAITRE